MQDLTLAENTDFTKLKVPELKKELKSRGLSTVGNKNELMERLQACLRSKDDGDNGNKSVDDLEEDLLNDEDDDHLVDPDESDAVLAELETTIIEQPVEPKGIKRKSSEGTKSVESTSPKPKKIVLNRKSSTTQEDEVTVEVKEPEVVPVAEIAENGNTTDKKVVKLSQLSDKERLEMRAKKFGTPLPVEVKKLERAERFGTITATSNKNTITSTPTVSIGALKQRAERFGGSVSSEMSKLENIERLEKRKARFGITTTTTTTAKTTAVTITSPKTTTTTPITAPTTETTTTTTKAVNDDKAKQRLERFKQTAA